MRSRLSVLRGLADGRPLSPLLGNGLALEWTA
jgi:hypothetical protein